MPARLLQPELGVRRRVQSEVADLVKAARQYMQKEPADKHGFGAQRRNGPRAPQVRVRRTGLRRSRQFASGGQLRGATDTTQLAGVVHPAHSPHHHASEQIAHHLCPCDGTITRANSHPLARKQKARPTLLAAVVLDVHPAGRDHAVHVRMKVLQ